MADEQQQLTEAERAQFDEQTEDLHIITLRIDDDGRSHLDLGDVPPPMAMGYLEEAAKACRTKVPYPVMIFEGETIFDPECPYGDPDWEDGEGYEDDEEF